MAATSSISSSKTVFVIGAGASKEVRLPIGSELRKSISKALDIRLDGNSRRLCSGDPGIYGALDLATKERGRGTSVGQLIRAAWRIRDAMPQAISIDNFIDAHNGDKDIELCGKLAIARTILAAEEKSSLFSRDERTGQPAKLRFDKLEDTWFTSFMQLLTENCNLSEIPHRVTSVALVIFNYDRCVEHYLYHALQNYYSIGPADAASLIQRIEIVHPYGTVGSLPWIDQKDTIEFGDTSVDVRQILKFARQIKTFTEGTDESSGEISAIRANMKTAQRIVFLGFAFHRLNLDLLFPDAGSPGRSKKRRVFATAHGISASDSESISADLAAKAGIVASNIQIRNDLTCCQLFREYWRSMSFV